jgi:hypothetical protein
MLCDSSGAVRDFVGWGYTSTQIASINIPTVTVGTSTYTNITFQQPNGRETARVRTST